MNRDVLIRTFLDYFSFINIYIFHFSSYLMYISLFLLIHTFICGLIVSHQTFPSNSYSDIFASHIEQVAVPTEKLIHPSSRFSLNCNAIWRNYCRTSSDTTWRFTPVKASGSEPLWGHVMSALEFCINICGSFCCFRAEPVLKP